MPDRSAEFLVGLGLYGGWSFWPSLRCGLLHAPL